MRTLHLAAWALLFVTGGLSTACAQSPQTREYHDQEPPPPPDPPRQDDRRERIKQLEDEIHRLEERFKHADNDRMRDELKKVIGDRRMQLDELRAGEKRLRGDVKEKMARLEKHIHELEKKLEREDLGPEDRRELSAQLERTRAQMNELRQQAKGQEQWWRDPGPKGPPLDPETQKMHEEAQQLERDTMDLAARLRRLPKDNKDDREPLTSKLKDSVTQLFEIREKLRAKEVEMLKKRLEELTGLLEKRKTNRDAIIEKRIKQLLGEADPLDW